MWGGTSLHAKCIIYIHVLCVIPDPAGRENGRREGRGKERELETPTPAQPSQGMNGLHHVPCSKHTQCVCTYVHVYHGRERGIQWNPSEADTIETWFLSVIARCLLLRGSGMHVSECACM